MSFILESIDAHANNQPDKTAIISEGDAISYQQLADHVANFCQQISTANCHTIAVETDNCPEWILADLAGMRLGLTVVPIPGFFSTGQVAHLLETAQVDLLIRNRELSPGNEWQQITTNCSGIWFYKRIVEPCVDAAKVTFTSGSTGTPKGVVLGQQAIDDTTRGIVSALQPQNLKRHLCVLPFATLLENIAGIYAPLVNGSELEVVLQSKVGLAGASLDIEKFIALLKKTEADSMILVPQLLTAIVTLSEMHLIDLSNFKMIAVGGGRVSKGLLDRAEALALPVHEGYGLSECGSVVALNLPSARRPGSVGKPLPHAQVRQSDEGELEVRGTVMDGYLNGQPLPSDQWLATGDLGYVDEEGFIFITGRRKNLFITAYGRNVNPEWMEAALSQHPAIAHALAYGEAEEHNLALLWLRFETSDAELDTIKDTVNQELPDYAQIHDFFVIKEPLPPELQTTNGRLKRDQALERYSEIIRAHYEPQRRKLNHVIL